MKNLIFFLLFCLLPNLGNSQPSTDYRLIFSDEFEDGIINQNYWLVSDCGSDQPYFEMASNVIEEGGMLRLLANEEEVTCNGKTRSLSASNVQSNAMFKYGYYEIKAKMPEGNGFYSAFWFHTPPSCSPDMYREIDVFENCGCNCGQYQAGFFFEDDGNGLNEYSNNSHPNSDIGDPSDACGNFYTYAVEWTPTFLKFYFEGAVVYEKQNSDMNASLFLILGTGLNILTCEEGNNFSDCEIDGNTILPGGMEVEYVKGWKKVNTVVTIEGPNQLCVGDEKIYFAPHYPGATYEWSCSSGLQMVPDGLNYDCSQALGINNRAKVKAVSAGTQTLTLKVTFPSGYVETKNYAILVRPGKPAIPNSVIAVPTGCAYLIRLPQNIPNASYYHWKIHHVVLNLPDEEYFTYTNNGQYPGLGIPYTDNYLIVKVSAGNLCGESNFYTQMVSKPYVPGCQGYYLIGTPNPTTTDIEVKVMSSEFDQVESTASGNLIIIDNLGNIKHASTLNNGTKTVDVINFNSGSYQIIFNNENLSLNTSFIKND